MPAATHGRDDGIGQQVQQQRRDREDDDQRDAAGGIAAGHHGDAVAPHQPPFMGGEPGHGGGRAGEGRHQAATAVVDVHFLLRDEIEEDFLERGLAADAGAQFGERAFGDEAAVIDHADSFGHALGDFEDVGGHDDGDALLHLARAAPASPAGRSRHRGR